MMRIKQFLCTICITLSAAATTYGSTYTAQTITVASQSDSDAAIDITNSKVITDRFSFKIPDGWEGNCIAVHEETSLKLYNKSAYETDGSGLLFTITAYEDSSYEDLGNYSILGFCGNTTYVLEEDYIDSYSDCDSAEYQACQSSVKALKKSFISFIKN